MQDFVSWEHKRWNVEEWTGYYFTIIINSKNSVAA